MNLGPPSSTHGAPGAANASVLLPVRNQAATVAEAIASVLAATDLRLDVLILDDASTDGTAAAIAAALRAAPPHPHAVRCWTAQPHRGLDGNGALTAAAATDFCIVQHADDRSEPSRFRRLADLGRDTGADVLSSNVRLVDEDGVLAPRPDATPTGFLSAAQIVAQGWSAPMLGAALAWRRRVFADFPPLTTDYLAFGHDLLVPFRGALRNGFYYTSEPLLRYRLHADQWTHQLIDRRSPAAAREHGQFRLLAVGRAMRRDVEHLRAGATGGEHARLGSLLAAIARRQDELLADFITVRETLLRDGQRPLWIDAATFAEIQREGYRERFWNRGRWRRLKEWWKARPGRARQ